MSRRAFFGSLAAGGAGCVLAGGRWLEGEPLQDPFAPGAALRVEEGGLNPTPARWWKALPDGWVECGVCPRACRISEDERGTLTWAISTKVSMAARATPSPTQQNPQPARSKPCMRFIGPVTRDRRSSAENVCSSGTKRSSTEKSQLPVPRRPATCHVSWISTSPMRTTKTRRSSVFAPSRTTHAVPDTHAAWRMPLANAQRPVTRKPPGAATAWPVGM